MGGVKDKMYLVLGFLCVFALYVLNLSISRSTVLKNKFTFWKSHRANPPLPVTSASWREEFPIHGETFDVYEHTRERLTHEEVVEYVLGRERAASFFQAIPDPLLSEVRPRVSQFLLSNHSLCHSAPRLDFLLSVYSAPDHFEERQAVRQTWGQVSLFTNLTSRTMFLLGAVKDPKLQEEISAESSTFGDIVQADFMDSYHNLSYKGLSLLQWTQSFCTNAHHLVKTDDDLYVDVFQLVRLLNTLSHLSRFVVGELRPHSRIHRRKERYAVREELLPGRSFYPPYIKGWVYAMPQTVLSELYHLALTTPVFHIDDVHMTGLLAGQLNNFLFLNFNGKSSSQTFAPTYPKLAAECNSTCKKSIFQYHLTRLGKMHPSLIAEEILAALMQELNDEQYILNKNGRI